MVCFLFRGGGACALFAFMNVSDRQCSISEEHRNVGAGVLGLSVLVTISPNGCLWTITLLNVLQPYLYATTPWFTPLFIPEKRRSMVGKLYRKILRFRDVSADNVVYPYRSALVPNNPLYSVGVGGLIICRLRSSGVSRGVCACVRWTFHFCPFTLVTLVTESIDKIFSIFSLSIGAYSGPIMMIRYGPVPQGDGLAYPP